MILRRVLRVFAHFSLEWEQIGLSDTKSVTFPHPGCWPQYKETLRVVTQQRGGSALLQIKKNVSIKSSLDAAPARWRVIAAPPASLITALAHPRNLFDINCRSQIISCRTWGRIYGWSHWLGAGPLIKFLKSPWDATASVYPLSSHIHTHTHSPSLYAHTHRCSYLYTHTRCRADNGEWGPCRIGGVVFRLLLEWMISPLKIYFCCAQKGVCVCGTVCEDPYGCIRTLDIKSPEQVKLMMGTVWAQADQMEV